MHLSVPPRQDGYARPVDQLGRLKLEQDAPAGIAFGGAAWPSRRCWSAGKDLPVTHPAEFPALLHRHSRGFGLPPCVIDDSSENGR